MVLNLSFITTERYVKNNVLKWSIIHITKKYKVLHDYLQFLSCIKRIK